MFGALLHEDLVVSSYDLVMRLKLSLEPVVVYPERFDAAEGHVSDLLDFFSCRQLAQEVSHSVHLVPVDFICHHLVHVSVLLHQGEKLLPDFLILLFAAVHVPEDFILVLHAVSFL